MYYKESQGTKLNREMLKRHTFIEAGQIQPFRLDSYHSVKIDPAALSKWYSFRIVLVLFICS